MCSFNEQLSHINSKSKILLFINYISYLGGGYDVNKIYLSTVIDDTSTLYFFLKYSMNYPSVIYSSILILSQAVQSK